MHKARKRREEPKPETPLRSIQLLFETLRQGKEGLPGLALRRAQVPSNSCEEFASF